MPPETTLKTSAFGSCLPKPPFCKTWIRPRCIVEGSCFCLVLRSIAQDFVTVCWFWYNQQTFKNTRVLCKRKIWTQHITVSCYLDAAFRTRPITSWKAGYAPSLSENDNDSLGKWFWLLGLQCLKLITNWLSPWQKHGMAWPAMRYKQTCINKNMIQIAKYDWKKRPSDCFNNWNNRWVIIILSEDYSARHCVMK